MAQLMGVINDIVQQWRDLKLNNRQAIELIERVMLAYQREVWEESHK